MSPRKCMGVALWLFIWACIASVLSGSFIGINIGTDVTNLPPESDIVSILKAQHVSHVRLFDANHNMLKALANTGIEVIVGVPNDQLLRIGQSQAEAANWVKQNVATFFPATNITHIAVGVEVLTSIPNAALVLVPAMKFLHSALVASELNFQVKISTPHSMDMIPRAFPPSTASFNSSWTSVMSQVLQFLKNTNAPFMLNAQPYFGFTKGNGIFPLEYALFQPLTPDKQIVDPNTDSSYTNMFDAMVDATYYSIQALNFSGIPILVTETGWPSFGGSVEPYATTDNALTYNTNLAQHIRNNSGTPSQPNTMVNAYIYELFNEDLKPGPISAKNWGIVSPNGTSIYTLTLDSPVEQLENSSLQFCIANSSAGDTALRKGIDWACGPGGANCTAIQPGQPCYDSNITDLASYAYNDYYHKMAAQGGSCYFDNTAYLTSNDPSHGLCIFTGSSGSNTSSSPSPPSPDGPSPDSPPSASLSSEISRAMHLGWLLLLHLV